MKREAEKDEAKKTKTLDKLIAILSKFPPNYSWLADQDGTVTIYSEVGNEVGEIHPERGWKRRK
jgi:hypothetical protein